MICNQNWHKEEDRSNYSAFIMLPKAAILVNLEVFVKPVIQETRICQHSVSEETGNSKVQTLSFGAKISKFSPGGGASTLSRGGGGL